MGLSGQWWSLWCCNEVLLPDARDAQQGPVLARTGGPTLPERCTKEGSSEGMVGPNPKGIWVLENYTLTLFLVLGSYSSYLYLKRIYFFPGSTPKLRHRRTPSAYWFSQQHPWCQISGCITGQRLCHSWATFYMFKGTRRYIYIYIYIYILRVLQPTKAIYI